MAKVHKWAFLKGKYPTIPMDADWMSKIDMVLDTEIERGESDDDFASKVTVRDLSDAALARRYNEVRGAKDELEAKVAVMNIEIAAYQRLFEQRFEDEGISSKLFEDGTRVTISPEPQVQIEDRAAILEWIHETGQQELLTFNSSTMAALVKNCILEGKVLPPGVNVNMSSRFSRTGSKGKQ